MHILVVHIPARQNPDAAGPEFRGFYCIVRMLNEVGISEFKKIQIQFVDIRYSFSALRSDSKKALTELFTWNV